jgi:hypothetical protein
MWKIIAISLIILFIGGYFIKLNSHYDVSKPSDQISLVKDLGKWIGNIGKNIGGIVGYVTKQKWSPPKQNITNTTTKWVEK